MSSCPRAVSDALRGVGDHEPVVDDDHAVLLTDSRSDRKRQFSADQLKLAWRMMESKGWSDLVRATA